MTTKDKDPHNPELDAEFEAFLQGQGELADLLRVMPQPTASAALDAAILADVDAALARDAKPVINAANDPIIPEAQQTASRLTSTFMARWKVPLGLAASVLLAIPLIMQWQRLPSNESAKLVATAPASPSPAPSVVVAQLAESAPEQKSAERADKDADFSQLAKADTEARSRTERRAAAPHVAAAGKAAAPATAVAAAKTENEPIVVASAEPADAKRESFAMRQAQRPAAAPAEASAFPQPPLVAAAPAPAKPAAFADAQAQLADAARPRIEDAAGAAAKALTSGGLTSGDTAPIEAKTSDTASIDKAKIWLLQIEKLIKTDMRKEALEEWAKFRQAYPNYPVQKPLLKQIDTLKSEVKH